MKTNYPIPVRERTINFPFEYYHYDKTNEFFVVPFHYHEEQQLFVSSPSPQKVKNSTPMV